MAKVFFFRLEHGVTKTSRKYLYLHLLVLLIRSLMNLLMVATLQTTILLTWLHVT